ncbi:OmpA family protein [Azomonas macrocytogenes]|uniref:Outer membrane protein OmpA-like peptidoglycan-associated protein n=1 Tax=Azomonas macrocytogenes TaxID=69962 RepID=A0A839T7D3_AZOMA|nr:OmpA family protein [Azomonas macrocytogenes]MBB3103583.1 outer membrane protein OmpA-like peptidoglycan-associated protein [Azomonas macrocytogenes]
MFTSPRLIIAATALSLLAGCASDSNNNPYGNQSGGQQGSSNHTATYGGIGAIAGAAAGALIDHDHRGRGALIGAALGGAGGAGYGYYADKQEAQLREQMAGTGVEVQRQGDDIKLIMPGNITFATNSADIAGNFYTPLNNLANSFKQYDQNTIEIVGYTDSTGSYQNNLALSQRRAQSVANYLIAQGVNGARVTTRGAGPDQPVGDNRTESGRAQNRRVEVNLHPLPQQPATQP